MQCGILAQVADGREAEDRRRRASAFRAQRGQLREVQGLPGAVGDAAMQTKAKGCWNVVAIESWVTLNAVRTNPHGLGQIPPAIGADPQRTLVFLQPSVWQALDHVLGSEWPWLRGTGIEETG